MTSFGGKNSAGWGRGKPIVVSFYDYMSKLFLIFYLANSVNFFSSKLQSFPSKHKLHLFDAPVYEIDCFIPEPTARSAVPGVSPGRGLLIPHGYLHPGKSEHSEV